METKSKGGRPKSENPKDQRVIIRMTGEEVQLLKEKAKERNTTISKLIRSTLLT